MTDQILYLKDLAARKTISKDEWMRGDKISFLDCVNGSGNVEHIPKGQLFSKKDTNNAGHEKIEKGGNILWFGKYRGKTKQWVEENDWSYFCWATENVDGFSGKSNDE